ncbi:MAG: carboxypeptidase regulatory-like domain-containing protein [Hyphomonadaceae bacterium]|nr:carboxypeptidase regulatory-like domain-containing protein [Clostridia bacterium]
MKKFVKLAIFVMQLVGLLALITMSVSASTAATSASIAVTVVQDDGKTPISTFSSGSIAVVNSAGETLDQSLDYLISSSGNVYTVSMLPYADTYHITFSKFKQSATIVVAATLSARAKTAKLVWSSSDLYTVAKSGVIAGTAVDAAGAILAGATVKAFNNKDVYYTTTSAAVTGAYKLFVPAGTYSLVVVGKDDTTNDYANASKSIKVTAGQAAGPMVDLSAQKPWSEMPYTAHLGQEGLTYNDVTKTISGTAYKGTTVTLYKEGDPQVDPIVYTCLGTQKITTKGTDTIGTFKFTVANYQATNDYVVRVTDTIFNTYNDSTLYVAPPTLDGEYTFVVGGGSVAGSAQFATIGVAAPGKRLAYVVSDKSALMVKVGDALTQSSPDLLLATTNITGLTATSKRYIHVYEIESSGSVVSRGKIFSLTSAQIKQQ